MVDEEGGIGGHINNIYNFEDELIGTQLSNSVHLLTMNFTTILKSCLSKQLFCEATLL